MNKLKYLWIILKDRWFHPYDDIILRFNTKAEAGDPLVWRVIVNGVEHLASSFDIRGHVYDILSKEGDLTKYNVGCKGRVRWNDTKAYIITSKPQSEELL